MDEGRGLAAAPFVIFSFAVAVCAACRPV